MNDTDQARLETSDMAQGEDYDAAVGEASASFPEYPDNPHNHRFTVSFDPSKPPFFVVRANHAEELKAAFAELETSGAYAAAGSAYDSLKRQGAIGAGIPSPAPSGPPMPPQGMPPAPPVQQFNQQPAQQFPGAPGTAPMAWQNAGAPPAPPQGGFGGGAPNPRDPKPRPAWPVVYKIEVPRAAKDQFKAYREQYKDAFKGKVAWAGGGAYWVHGDVVQGLAAYNPVPA